MFAELTTDSKAIFKQLGQLPPGAQGVQTVVENHDAWVHSNATLFFIDAAARAELQARAVSGPQAERIALQRNALGNLATVLPTRISWAG